MTGPVVPGAAQTGVLRSGYDTGGFYDEAFERDPAGGLDGVDVAAGEEDGLRVPDAPARLLQRGAQADDR